nr:MAG TPA: hypothetical protein [Caudoviricetes sp.]
MLRVTTHQEMWALFLRTKNNKEQKTILFRRR